MSIRSGHSPNWWDRIMQRIKNGTGLLSQKWTGMKLNHAYDQHAAPLDISADTANRLKREWRQALKAAGGAGSVVAGGAVGTPAEAGSGGNATSGAAAGGGLVGYTSAEQATIRRIQAVTAAANRNNVTRTAAYWDVYRRRPELHWAFLAHMVSRNGGWTMTDLQGELLPRLLNQRERRDLFHFLERANALIFQDAYPQLLLYEESVRLNRSLFHLLPAFHVSAFMRPVWELFWEARSGGGANPVSPALTVCLIINEQNYIEGRILQNGYYKTKVLDTLVFQTQSLLQLNQVLFPYRPDGTTGHRLVGAILQDFGDLRQRVEMGRTLYGLLFGIPEVRKGAEAYASQHPHTASRSDYNPLLFAPVKKAPPSTKYTEKLDGCALKAGAAPLYSPPLASAWKDEPVADPERYDWFRDLQPAEALRPVAPADSAEITAEACAALRAIELAVLAAEAVGLDEDV